MEALLKPSGYASLVRLAETMHACRFIHNLDARVWNDLAGSVNDYAANRSTGGLSSGQYEGAENRQQGKGTKAFQSETPQASARNFGSFRQRKSVAQLCQ
jgi:hypothetical protein